MAREHGFLSEKKMDSLLSPLCIFDQYSASLPLAGYIVAYHISIPVSKADVRLCQLSSESSIAVALVSFPIVVRKHVYHRQAWLPSTEILVFSLAGGPSPNVRLMLQCYQ